MIDKIKIGYRDYNVVYDNKYLDEKELTGEIDYYNKKNNCWDEEMNMRQNIMTYIGLGEDDSMPYKCNNEDGLVFIWKNIELADDENA